MAPELCLKASEQKTKHLGQGVGGADSMVTTSVRRATRLGRL